MNTLTVLEIKAEYAGVLKVIYPVLVSDEQEVILIDCGFPGFFPVIKEAAAKDGIDLDKLTRIIITHHDYDHIGDLAQFKKKYPRVQVFASKEEEPYISGKKKTVRLQQIEDIFDTIPEEEKEGVRNYQKVISSLEGVEVDVLLEDKDSFPWCGGIEIVATPGHMPGHISVYIKESRTLIAGDALIVEDGKLALANPDFALDIETAKSSARKLLQYQIDRVICYHGGSCTENIKELLPNV